MLDHLADDGDTGRAQQLAQFGEIVALLERGDAERALLRASFLSVGAACVLAYAPLPGSLHRFSLVSPWAAEGLV
jgi:hypothetical protein